MLSKNAGELVKYEPIAAEIKKLSVEEQIKAIKSSGIADSPDIADKLNSFFSESSICKILTGTPNPQSHDEQVAMLYSAVRFEQMYGKKQ